MYITEQEFFEVQYLDHRIAKWELVRSLMIGCLFGQVIMLILWLAGSLLPVGGHVQFGSVNLGAMLIAIVAVVQTTRKRLRYVLKRNAIFNTIRERE